MFDDLLLKDGSLSRKQKEYNFLVCSAANLSTYSVTAHCEMVRTMHVEEPEPEQSTYGFSEQQILEAVLVIGWAKFANTVAFGLGTVPDFQSRRVAEEVGKAGLSTCANTEGDQ